MIIVDKIIESTPKTFIVAKGNLNNDYQQYLDQEWIKDLRNSNTINTNKTV